MAITTGTIIPYGGSSAPAGFLFCDGSAVSRTTYSTLFGVIGTTFGSGDGSTTFNVPDLRGRVVAGRDNMGGSAAGRLTSTTMSPDGNTVGATGGEETHTLVTSEMPSHTHTASVTDSGHAHSLWSSSGGGSGSTVAGFGSSGISTVCGLIPIGGTAAYYSTFNAGHAVMDSGTTGITVSNADTGGDGAHDNVQPTLILNYIIATQDVAGSGTVTSVSVVSANGLAGSVANATTTPAITLSTSITGVLKGDGTAISAATSGTDYVIPSGNVATATALQTARTINGVAFDGTANITVTAAAGTLTGTTLNSSVVSSSLTSVGTIGTGVWQGTAVAVSYGGTGLSTLTNHAVLLGAGTSNVNFATVGTAGRLLIDQGASADPSFNAMSGDATIDNTGAITVSKTNGAAFAASATTDTTNAANISSGTIPGARLGAVGGTYLGDTQNVAQTLTLIAYAPYAFTINSLKNLGTVSGTVTGTLKINGSPVTGCSSLSLTSTPQNATATAANTVSVGDSVTFVTSSPSALTGLLPFSLIATRS